MRKKNWNWWEFFIDYILDCLDGTCHYLIIAKPTHFIIRTLNIWTFCMHNTTFTESFPSVFVPEKVNNLLTASECAVFTQNVQISLKLKKFQKIELYAHSRFICFWCSVSHHRLRQMNKAAYVRLKRSRHISPSVWNISCSDSIEKCLEISRDREVMTVYTPLPIENFSAIQKKNWWNGCYFFAVSFIWAE